MRLSPLLSDLPLPSRPRWYVAVWPGHHRDVLKSERLADVTQTPATMAWTLQRLLPITLVWSGHVPWTARWSPVPDARTGDSLLNQVSLEYPSSSSLSPWMPVTLSPSPTQHQGSFCLKLNSPAHDAALPWTCKPPGGTTVRPATLEPGLVPNPLQAPCGLPLQQLWLWAWPQGPLRLDGLATGTRCLAKKQRGQVLSA